MFQLSKSGFSVSLYQFHEKNTTFYGKMLKQVVKGHPTKMSIRSKEQNSSSSTTIDTGFFDVNVQEEKRSV